jgi:hypothetical protein
MRQYDVRVNLRVRSPWRHIHVAERLTELLRVGGRPRGSEWAGKFRRATAVSGNRAALLFPGYHLMKFTSDEANRRENGPNALNPPLRS